MPIRNLKEEAHSNRKADYDINPLFVERWSPRSMLSERLDEEDRMALFEAARWAPSSYNNQHWRFLYSENGDQNWDKFVELMNDQNAAWAENSGMLVVMCSKKTFDHNGEPAQTHSFDTGSAWENLALEAIDRNIAVHAMQGFDYEKAREVLNIPEDFEVEAMLAAGYPDDKESLPEELQEREVAKGRKDLDKIVSQGSFDF